MKTNHNKKTAFQHHFELAAAVCYFGLYLIIALSLLIKQPFGNPPDEYNRYLIPQYIAENGALPNGYEESIRIGGYGFSYGFQPILPYMFQGYAMRFMTLFTSSEAALLYTARAVNLLLGLCTAWVILLLSKKWFRDRRFGWLFAYLTTFLPQSIFVHTYVNTDSCCMLSIAVMLYGLTLGLESGFSRRSSLILSAGIILCALSYYNAYGYILSCILLFTAFYLSAPSGHIRFDLKSFLKKGIFISVIVLLGIGWWFIRSAILYEGDFLGLQARHECASLYAIPEFHPDTRVTWQNQGYSFWDMMVRSDFWTLSVMSFIGVYGPMTITTSIWVYRFYKALFLLGLGFCVFLPVRRTAEAKGLHSKRRAFRRFYHINMLFCILMPLFLSLFYSYTTDYQPQGRYLLPALLPVCYYAVHGLEKAWLLLTGLTEDRRKTFPKEEDSLKEGASLKKGRPSLTGKAASSSQSRLLTCAVTLACMIIIGLLLLTVYGYAFPYYEANPIAP